MAPFLARLGVFRLGLIRAHAPDPDLPPRARAELQAFFNTSTYLETVRAVDTAFAQRWTRCVTRAGSAQSRWRLCWAARATAAWNPYATCSRSRPRSRPTAARDGAGATHVGLVDNRVHAAQTTAVILQVVEAARVGSRSGHAPEVVLDGSAPLLYTSSARTSAA